MKTFSPQLERLYHDYCNAWRANVEAKETSDRDYEVASKASLKSSQLRLKFVTNPTPENAQAWGIAEKEYLTRTSAWMNDSSLIRSADARSEARNVFEAALHEELFGHLPRQV